MSNIRRFCANYLSVCKPRKDLSKFRRLFLGLLYTKLVPWLSLHPIYSHCWCLKLHKTIIRRCWDPPSSPSSSHLPFHQLKRSPSGRTFRVHHLFVNIPPRPSPHPRPRPPLPTSTSLSAASGATTATSRSSLSVPPRRTARTPTPESRTTCSSSSARLRRPEPGPTTARPSRPCSSAVARRR